MSPRESLEPYRKKRDPARTPEPFGEDAPGAKPAPATQGSAVPGGNVGRGLPLFVVQKHWARNMHYDLRLELDGTLKSWAVPKGPSTHAEERRLAVHVEDHPLEYGDFEGVIPEGNYGAGSVIVWDRGGFRSFKPEGPLEQYENGKLELELFGFKLRGRWTLVRMGKKDKEWLLLKKADGGATRVEQVDRYPESVITGLTVEEMRDVPGTIAALRERAASLEAPRRAIDPEKISFMLATLAEKPVAGDDWLYEIKYDGVRVLAWRDGEDALRLFGRSGEEITHRYPEIDGALRALPAHHFILDGEIVAEDERGRPSFQRLQPRMHLSKPRDIEGAMLRVPVRAMFFDALSVEGYDLRGVPLAERKELLARVLPPLGTVQRSEHVEGNGQAFYEAASELGLEGVLAKRANSTYTGRRSADWLKIKCQRRQEFVIGGYTEPQGSRARFGALHVGVYEDGKLVYVTKVGTGFGGEELDRVSQALEPLKRETSPFEVDSPKGKGHHWVEPKLVCEVRFTEWTHDGGLRHPTYMGLRSDRKPEDVRREEPVDSAAEHEAEPVEREPTDGEATDGGSPETDKAAAPAPRPRAAHAKTPAASASPAREVKLSNQKKVFWPEDGYTKGDLIAYYDAVAPLMLPYLRGRPAVLTRYPDGIHGKSFFQKDAPDFVPDWIRTVPIEEGRGTNNYFVLDDAESLRFVANLGTIPIHAWSARVDALEHPDWMVLDLDPKTAPFTNVVKVARVVKGLLDELELPSTIKTSGASGLHVMVPMGRRYTHEETRTFARVLATLVVQRVPDIATVVRAVQARGGKVYVDFGQNGFGITVASVYCVRPLPGAPVSCPLRWDEVTMRLDPKAFTIKTLPPRFESMPDPLVDVLGEGVDVAATLERIQRGMSEGRPDKAAGADAGEYETRVWTSSRPATRRGRRAGHADPEKPRTRKKEP